MFYFIIVALEFIVTIMLVSFLIRKQMSNF